MVVKVEVNQEVNQEEVIDKIMEPLFRSFFVKFPMEFSEMFVIKQIHKELETAEKQYKKHKEGQEHIKYLAKAYSMLIAYFEEKGVNPNSYLNM